MCKQTVHEYDIQLAEKLLVEFCDLFEKYYGLTSITLNIHLLRHYGYVVRNNGPLWCHSLFGFETNMGVLKKYYAGGRFTLNQITEKCFISKSLRENKAVVKEPTCSIHVEGFEEYDHFFIENGLKYFKKFAQISTPNGIYKSLASKHSKSIDYFFQMKNGTVGAAAFYVMDESSVYVLIQMYNEQQKNYHLTEIYPTQNYSVFPLDSIKEKVLYLKFSTIEVITKEPCMYERC